MGVPAQPRGPGRRRGRGRPRRPRAAGRTVRARPGPTGRAALGCRRGRVAAAGEPPADRHPAASLPRRGPSPRPGWCWTSSPRCCRGPLATAAARGRRRRRVRRVRAAVAGPQRVGAGRDGRFHALVLALAGRPSSRGRHGGGVRGALQRGAAGAGRRVRPARVPLGVGRPGRHPLLHRAGSHRPAVRPVLAGAVPVGGRGRPDGDLRRASAGSRGR